MAKSVSDIPEPWPRHHTQSPSEAAAKQAGDFDRWQSRIENVTTRMDGVRNRLNTMADELFGSLPEQPSRPQEGPPLPHSRTVVLDIRIDEAAYLLTEIEGAVGRFDRLID